MEWVVERSNVTAAWKRVKQNKGNPGIDGMTVEELYPWLVKHGEAVRAQLLDGTYQQPTPVREQVVPKSGGGVRTLGIPTVLDRRILQAVL
jgi:RNA-directed DNA polymerase